jgi:outer membrane receptor protein involved in Fe transport
MKTRESTIRLFRPAFILTGLVCSLPHISLNAQTMEADVEVFELSPFNVSAAQDRGYGVANSLGASRIALANLDIASSVITLNEQLIEDVGAIDAAEFLQYVSGVQIGSDRNPGQVFYSLRGYAASGISLRDGLPDPFDSVDVPLDEESSYERIEVIKGPAGTLYGSHSMGGVVNKVSKWPLLDQKTQLQLQVAAGHDEFVRGVVDTTGPIGESTAYRAVLSYRNGERHFDEADAPSNMRNLTLSGAHYFKSGGKVWARAQYLDYKLDREQGWQYITGYLTPGGDAPEVKNSVFAIGKHANIVPSDDISKGDIYSLEAGYEKNFRALSGVWTVRFVARKSKGDGDKSPSYSQGRPVAVDAAGNSLGDHRFVSASDPNVADWRASLTLRDFRGYAAAGGVFLDLVGKFDTFGISHDLVINATATESERVRAFFFWAAANPNDPTAIGNTFSAVNPDFTGVNAQSIKANNPKQFNRFQGFATGEGRAIGFQDNIGLFSDKLTAVVGARYDEVEGTNTPFDVAASLAADEFVKENGSRSSSKGKDSTYKVGLVYKPTSEVSLFTHRSTTFNLVTASDPLTGNKFPNQEGEILEIGTKFSMFDNRLVLTASWFDMELTNVIIQVPLPIDQGGGTIPQAVGVQATDGFEVDLAWQPTDQLSFIFAMSDLDSTDANGNFFRGVPIDLNYSFFGKYAFTDGDLAGFFCGLGFQHNAQSPGDGGSTFFVSDSNLMDLFAGYEAGNWSVQLNVYNVLGENQILSTVIDRLAIRAPDTNFRITARYRF